MCSDAYALTDTTYTSNVHRGTGIANKARAKKRSAKTVKCDGSVAVTSHHNLITVTSCIFIFPIPHHTVKATVNRLITITHLSCLPDNTRSGLSITALGRHASVTFRVRIVACLSKYEENLFNETNRTVPSCLYIDFKHLLRPLKLFEKKSWQACAVCNG